MALAMPTHVVAPFLNTAAEGLGRADLALKQVGQAALLMPVAFLVEASSAFWVSVSPGSLASLLSCWATCSFWGRSSVCPF